MNQRIISVYGIYFGKQSLTLLCFHVRPQHRVYAGLITASMGFEPFQNVIINALGDGSLGLRHHDVGIFPERLIRRLGVGVRRRCRVNFGLGHIFDLLPVCLCVFREIIKRNSHGTFVLHGDLPSGVRLLSQKHTICIYKCQDN